VFVYIYIYFFLIYLFIHTLCVNIYHVKGSDSLDVYFYKEALLHSEDDTDANICIFIYLSMQESDWLLEEEKAAALKTKLVFTVTVSNLLFLTHTAIFFIVKLHLSPRSQHESDFSYCPLSENKWQDHALFQTACTKQQYFHTHSLKAQMWVCHYSANITWHQSTALDYY